MADNHFISLLSFLVILIIYLNSGNGVDAHAVHRGWAWTSTTTSRPVVKHCPPGMYWSLVFERCLYKNYNYNQGRFTSTHRPLNNGWEWTSTSTTTAASRAKGSVCPRGLYWSDVLQRCWEFGSAHITASEEALIGQAGKENNGWRWMSSTTTSTPRPRQNGKDVCPEGQYWYLGECHSVTYASPGLVYASSGCQGGCGRGSYCDRARDECRSRRRFYAVGV